MRPYHTLKVEQPVLADESSIRLRSEELQLFTQEVHSSFDYWSCTEKLLGVFLVQLKTQTPTVHLSHLNPIRSVFTGDFWVRTFECSGNVPVIPKLSRERFVLHPEIMISNWDCAESRLHPALKHSCLVIVNAGFHSQSNATAPSAASPQTSYFFHNTSFSKSGIKINK